MSYQGYHKQVRITVDSATYDVNIDDLKINAFPYSGAGNYNIQLFDGRHKTRLDGWKVRAAFDWQQFDLSDHEQWEEIMVALEANNYECEIDFDFTDAPGQRTETFVVENADSLISAIFDKRGHIRPASVSFISTNVLSSVPLWIVGDTQSFVPTHIYYTTDVGVARVPIAGGTEEHIFNSAANGYNIVIDKVSGSDIYIYNQDEEIIRMDRDGVNAVILSTTAAASNRGLAIDTAAGYFFTREDTASPGSIYRYNLDGTGKTLLTTANSTGMAGNSNSIAVDRVNQRLFYLENPTSGTGNSDIRVINYDGTGNATLANNIADTLFSLSYDPAADLLFVTTEDDLLQVPGTGIGSTTLISGLDLNLNVSVDHDQSEEMVYVAVRPTGDDIIRSPYTTGGSTIVHTDNVNNVYGAALGEGPEEVTYYALVWIEDDKIMAMDTDGNVSTLYTGTTTGARGICTDDQGNIYVAERTNDRISKHSSDGTQVSASFIAANDIYGISWWDGYLYWSQRTDDLVARQADDASGSPSNIITSTNNLAYLRVWDDVLYFIEDGDFKSNAADGTGSKTTYINGAATGGGGQVTDGYAVYAEWGATELRRGDVIGAPDSNLTDLISFVDDPNQVIVLNNGRCIMTDTGNGRILAFDIDGTNQQVLYRTTGSIRGIAERVHPNP